LINAGDIVITGANVTFQNVLLRGTGLDVEDTGTALTVDNVEIAPCSTIPTLVKLAAGSNHFFHYCLFGYLDANQTSNTGLSIAAGLTGVKLQYCSFSSRFNLAIEAAGPFTLQNTGFGSLTDGIYLVGANWKASDISNFTGNVFSQMQRCVDTDVDPSSIDTALRVNNTFLDSIEVTHWIIH
jgi:hypothetical protein